MPISTRLARRLTTLLVALVAAGASLPVAAQWKWRDPSGQTQYSDRPPPAGTPEAAIQQRPQPLRRLAVATSAPALASASAASAAAFGLPPAPKPGEPELEARRRKAEQDETAKKKADEQRQAGLRADNCSRARGQLRALEDGMRIARMNENGEREVLDDDARAAETQRVLALVAADCR
jgi:hypothetical protein